MRSERQKEIRNAKARARNAIRRAGLELAKAQGTIAAVRERIGESELCEELRAVDRAIVQIADFVKTYTITSMATSRYHTTGKQIDAGTLRDSVAQDAAGSVAP